MTPEEFKYRCELLVFELTELANAVQIQNAELYEWLTITAGRVRKAPSKL